ncbi:BZ3500_MvSof-1268-A1-R1_Chr8-2g10103 [Microbotryum saponariae]|uniref:BQ5605_C003g02101 protein n=2 Tax=Microbotryum TaxID=34416 RepID=A0A2X0P3G4_9BASI|nr:BZ3500_MvSof-1268-A1-R1_Chr8-2g10103 [Microbotryum saponariae]SDA01792.1 BZ3501_MvSof-1269-A2-R1_Chr8-2g09854 [Microbotryum saponariae]SGY38905.1 BQ5605_C003g02101 [Microbotryum silenes-dioicae]
MAPPSTPLEAAGNKIPGVDHAKIAKLDRENEVAPPPTVSLELGKVLQQARQNFKDADGNPKPMSQGDLAKAINQKQTVIQEYENMRAKPDPALLGKMERILKVKLRGSGIGQPLGGPKKK